MKILVTTSPESRRLVTFRPPIRRLYMKAVPPATIGMYAYPRFGGASRIPDSVSPYGISETAKSAVPFLNCSRPTEDPTGE